MSDMRVMVIGSDTDFAQTVRGALAAQLPDAGCDRLEAEELRMRPTAAALVIDGRADRTAAAEVVRRVRAMGFTGGLIVVYDGDARAVAFEQLGHELLPRMGEALAEASSPYIDVVMRARRLVAAGEVALKLQHSLNNPLAGLLAEAQLMQMEDSTAEQRESLERMVALCRRMVEVTRSLDGMGERASRAENLLA
jgi:C4-dicarboxylate-specific signal transduction histidine kinase